MRIIALILAFFVVFAAGQGMAESTRKATLDRLFAALHSGPDVDEANQLTTLIWVVWNHTDDPETDLHLTEGQKAMERLEFEAALKHFNAVIDREPDFAEGWNKRATLYYVMGEYRASMKDIDEVLSREPRHFGALAGLGMNLEALGQDQRALNAWRRALKINPYLPDAHARVRALEKSLINRPI